MESHTFKIAITGNESEATQKANAIAKLAQKLDAKTLAALARVVENDPSKVALAKKFLGL